MSKEEDRYIAYEKRQRRKKILGGFAKLEDPERQGGTLPHSSAYHSYFEGYAEFTRLDDRGRRHVERVYAMPYERAIITEKERIWRKLGYPLLWVLAVIGLFASALPGGGATRSVLSVIPTVAALLALVFCGRGLYNTCTAPEKMTIGQYRAGSEMLVRWAGIGALCLLLTGAGILVYLLLHPGEGDLVQALWTILGGGALGCLFLLERSIHYEKVPNPVELPSDAVLIE